ncbi:hypothetical protein GOP47_0023237 [Adiantum capillus-veneris]|uniref:Chitin-binding type-2 domain-containing protein n=1 Tax=Adiantum capillus-veneris TaxID=13818 RepID=A0A9D4U744_ADICA|nr:hypothetical protein GOP47_0023237 [Adiantum capillus-veneris]
MARLFCMLMIVGISLFSKAGCDASNTTFCAGKPNGPYANPSSCSSFWACWDNGLKGVLLLCPPNTLWHQPSLSCTHTDTRPNTTITSTSTPPASSLNHSSPTTALPALSNSTLCSTHPSRHHLHLPIWSWDGLLHCYGYGCLINTRNVLDKVDIGIPCGAAQELIAIGRRSTQAWMPAPHEVAEGDVGKAGGQHWKIRFDDVKGESMLKATVTDYSPAERIMGGWQGGAMGEALQFSLRGPRDSKAQKGNGACYYAVALESPALKGMWRVFAKDLVQESIKKSKRNSQAKMAQLDDLFPINWKKRHVHTNMLDCLRNIPWPSLVATALCYASNVGGGLQGMSLCATDLPSTDLFTIANCFASLLKINFDLGL